MTTDELAALAASPEVQALIREAEARGMERAAEEIDSCDADLADFIRGKAAAIRGEGK